MGLGTERIGNSNGIFVPPRRPCHPQPPPGSGVPPHMPPPPAGVAWSQAEHGAARLALVLDRHRRMREGRAAGVPWGDGGGTADLAHWHSYPLAQPGYGRCYSISWCKKAPDTSGMEEVLITHPLWRQDRHGFPAAQPVDSKGLALPIRPYAYLTVRRPAGAMGENLRILLW